MTTLTCIENFIDPENNQYGCFLIEPLQTGQGITLGNALRRTLLSDLTGYAITGVRINNIKHEFSAIQGLREDILEVILNLKEIVFQSSYISRSKAKKWKAFLNIQGPIIVTAMWICAFKACKHANIFWNHRTSKRSSQIQNWAIATAVLASCVPPYRIMASSSCSHSSDVLEAWASAKVSNTNNSALACQSTKTTTGGLVGQRADNIETLSRRQLRLSEGTRFRSNSTPTHLSCQSCSKS